MRRTFLIPATLALTVLAGCGGYTDAEQRFLDEMKQRSPLIEPVGLDKDLVAGHTTCEVLADVKPAERASARYFLQQPSQFGYGVVSAATTHLCPELKA